MSLCKRIDFHVHTNRSHCAQESLTLKKVITEYEKLRFKHIALVDHWHPVTNTQIFIEEFKEIQEIKPSLNVYLSAEVDILNSKGKLSFEENKNGEALEKLDFVTVAPHHYQLDWVETPQGKVDKIIEHSHRMLMSVCKRKIVDVIAHPWLVDLKSIKCPWIKSLEEVPYKYLVEFAQCAASNRKAVEISAGIFENKPDRYSQSYVVLVEEFLRAGVKVTLGSDVHSPGGLGKTQGAVRLFERCGGINKDLWLPNS